MKTRYIAQLLLLSALWGVSFLMIRIAGHDFPPPWVGLLRCATGTLFLWTVLVFGGHKLPPRKLIFWLLLVALTNNAIPFTFFAWGESVIPSSTAAVINSTTPIWTLLLSLAVTRKRASLNSIFGVMLGFAGVALVVNFYAPGEAAVGKHGNALWGLLVIGIGSLGYAIATVVAKIKLRGLDPIGLATMQLSLAAFMLAPVAIFGPHPLRIHLPSAVAVLVLGLAGSGVAYLLFYSLLSHVSATQVSAVTYLLPLWGMFWGSIANEAATPLAYVGAVIVVSGLVLVNNPNRSATSRVMTAEACAD
jgi:drug/metabolite transporter (DMT)-like permease